MTATPDMLMGPITTWPGKLRADRDRLDAPFEAGWSATRAQLELEGRQLEARTITVRLALPERCFTKDREGLRADARQPEHPGVIVVIDSRRHGVLTYHTDRFRGRSYRSKLTGWQSNVRAVALALEALRRVDRYGIAEAGEQYAGWKELGSGIAMGAAPVAMTVDEAARLLADAPGVPYSAESLTENLDKARDAYRRAAKATHPDAGGTDEQFKRVGEAWRLLHRHHRGEL